MSKNNEKIARICWNANGWTTPSGKEGKSKSENSYEKISGFGHEEWLLDMSKIYKGYHYGFLQPMNVKSGKHFGQTYDIHLFTISPQKQRIYVGCLYNAEGVGPDESKEVYGYYKKNGWIQQMEEEIRYVDGVVKDLDQEMMFNVKFKVKDAIIYESNPPILKSEYITNHYVLQNKDFSFEFEKDENGNDLVFNTKPIVHITKEGKTIIDPRHKKIQEAVCKLIKGDYKDIKAEINLSANFGQRVDISGVHKATGELHFFEVKTSSAKKNIREALGQILEYAHYPSEDRAKKMFIIGEKAPDRKDKKYLIHLRKLYNIPIWYRWYNFEDNTLSEEY